MRRRRLAVIPAALLAACLTVGGAASGVASPPRAATVTADAADLADDPEFEPAPKGEATTAERGRVDGAPVDEGPGAAPVVADQLLVKVRPAADAADVAADAGAELAPRAAQDAPAGWAVVDTSGTTLSDAGDELADDDRVAEVQPNYVRTLDRVPNDVLYEEQAEYLDEIRVERGWDIRAAASSAQVVAVVDSGVDATHQDLRGRVLTGRNLLGSRNDTSTTDDTGHGTLVAGVVAAAAGNRNGIAGVASGARILPVKVFDEDGRATDVDIAEGIRWAAQHGATVITMSFSGGGGEAPLLQEAVSYARSRGAVLVAATGNTYLRESRVPAALSGVIGVGATDDEGRLADFSTWGPTVDVVAPGVGVIGPGAGAPQSYVAASGTSFSTPIVAGVVALTRTKYPSWTPAQVEQRIIRSAQDSGPRGRDESYGYGMVDAAAALGEYVPAAERPAVAADGDDFASQGSHLDLAVGETVTATGRISEADEDWYAVSAPGLGVVTATVTAEPRSDDPTDRRQLDPVLEIYDSRAELVDSRDRTDDPTADEQLTVTVGGDFFVKVRNYNGSASRGEYTLTLLGSAGPGTPSPQPAESDLVWMGAADPGRHQDGVDPTGNLRTQLLRDVTASSVTASSVRLVDGVTGSTVPATARLAGRTLTVDPSADLRPNRPYRLVVDGLRDGTAEQVVPVTVDFRTARPGGAAFTPLTTRRVLETRAAYGGPVGVATAGPVRPGRPVDLALAGVAGVPDDATAVVLGVTGVRPTAATRVQLSAAVAGGSRSTVADLEVAKGGLRCGEVTVPLGPDGTVRLTTTAAPLDLLVDVVGFYAPGGRSGFTPVPATRLVHGAKLGKGGTRDVVVAGASGLPAEASAAILRLTASKPTRATSLAVTPKAPVGSSRQSVAHLRLPAGGSGTNLVTVPVGADGKVLLANASGSVYVSVDVVGVYERSGTTGFRAAQPTAVVETRAGQGGPVGVRQAGPLPRSSTTDVAVRGGSGARALSAWLQAVAGPAASSVTLGPTTSTVPPRTLPVAARLAQSTGAVVPLGSDATLRLRTGGGAVDVRVVVSGWFAP